MGILVTLIGHLPASTAILPTISAIYYPRVTTVPIVACRNVFLSFARRMGRDQNQEPARARVFDWRPYCGAGFSTATIEYVYSSGSCMSSDKNNP